MRVLLRGIHLFLCLLQNYYALLAPQTQFTKREKVQGLSTLTFKHVGDSVWHVQNERKQNHDYLHHRAVEYGTPGNVADLTRGFFFFFTCCTGLCKAVHCHFIFLLRTNTHLRTKSHKTKEGNLIKKRASSQISNSARLKPIIIPKEWRRQGYLATHNDRVKEENGSRLGHKFSPLILPLVLTCWVKPIHTKKQGGALCIAAVVCTLRRRIRSTPRRGGKQKNSIHFTGATTFLKPSGFSGNTSTIPGAQSLQLL